MSAQVTASANYAGITTFLVKGSTILFAFVMQNWQLLPILYSSDVYMGDW